MIFREDDARIHSEESPQNRAVLCHLVLTILKKDAQKGSLGNKGYHVTLGDSFLLHLLGRV
jgi:hypothetical protein